MRSTHNRVDLWRNLCTSLLYFVVRARCRRKESSRSLSHFLMRFLSEKKNGWWRRPLLPKILGKPASVGAKSPIFNRYSLVAPRAVTPSEKSSINTNRKSITRFPMRLVVADRDIGHAAWLSVSCWSLRDSELSRCTDR